MANDVGHLAKPAPVADNPFGLVEAETIAAPSPPGLQPRTDGRQIVGGEIHPNISAQQVHHFDARTVGGADDRAAVRGTIPADPFGQGKAIEGRIDYTRTFTIDPKGLRIETRLKADGKDKIAELYETLPVLLGDGGIQKTKANVTIEFQVGGKWAPATDQYAEQVQAVRLTRFTVAVLVTFDRPRRVKLSPADWADAYMTRASNRNILIDLLESGDKPVVLRDASVSYQMQPVPK